MDLGMLWFDNSKRPLADKLHNAIVYYTEKYGTVPNLFIVNPVCFEEVTGKVVRASKSVLVNHIWVGNDAGVYATKSKVSESGS